VSLHLGALLLVERPGPQQQVVRKRDLADVVHRARDPDRLDVEAELAGEQRGVCAHPLCVAARLLIAVLDRAREAPHGLLARELQPRRRALERSCARTDDLLERLAVCAVFQLELAALQRVAGRDQHLVGIEGLDQVAVGAQLDRTVGQLGLVEAHHGDGRRARGLRQYELDQAQSGVVGQIDISDHQLEVLGRAEDTGGVCVLCDLAPVAGLPQCLEQRRLRAGLGVDYQDSLFVSA
jgi:hypothetical protein